ncbi:MAG: hypothetical protein KC464_16315, partial [Myxococcales bacterium]|nr:hypothetical protein [Myxococcales bacterium]
PAVRSASPAPGRPCPVRAAVVSACLTVALLLLLLATRPQIAHAQAGGPDGEGHRRVVLLSMPDQVFSATAAALGPWAIAVEASTEPPPADEAAAAAVAASHDATAVAWIEGAELIIYDALDLGLERRPAPTTIDDATAASIALTIKTALRRPLRVPAMVAFPGAGEPIPRPPALELDRPAPPPPAPRLIAHLAVTAGARVPTRTPAPTLPRISGRVSLGASTWRGLAVVAGAEAGPTADVTADGLAATYRDIGAVVGVAWRHQLRPRLWLVPAALAALHWTSLRGTLTTADGAMDVDQRDHAGAGELEVAVESGASLRVGAVLSATATTGPVRYQVRSRDVLVIPTLSVSLGLRVSY